MGIMNWQALAEQLRAIGVVVPAEGEALTKSASVRPVVEPSARESGTPPAQPSIKQPIDKTCEVDASSSSEIEEVSNTIKLATAAGVTFFERVRDGELVAKGLTGLPAALKEKLKSKRQAIRSALLPENEMLSLDLLATLGVELILIEVEDHARTEIARVCAAADILGIDIETAPRPEFLPIHWPITITKDGQRSRTQPSMDTSAALDPFRAEVRLLQLAAEIDGKSVALVIDLRRVPLGSPALDPLWQKKLVGHNLSFDAKMLMAIMVSSSPERIS